MPHVVITGSSSGIGAHLAVEQGRRGRSVGLIARRAPLLAEVAETVRSAGGKAAWVAADVTDAAAVDEAVRTLESIHGPVDLMVANAGGGGVSSPLAIDPIEIGRLMRLNYEGSVNAIAAVLPTMLERGAGHIAAISSLASYRGLAPSGGYSAAKAAISMLMEAFAVDLVPRGIAVTTVLPGFVRSPITDQNNFSMPFLMEADVAARRISDGLEARRRIIEFPWQMVLLMRVVRALPHPLFAFALRQAAPPSKLKK